MQHYVAATGVASAWCYVLEALQCVDAEPATLLPIATASVSKRGAMRPRDACLVTSRNVETRVRRLVAYRAPSRLGTLSLQLATLAALLLVLGVVATR